MELFFVLGLIGAEIIMINSDNLPAPELSSLTTVVYKDQSVVLHCTAPSNYPEGTFYLYSEGSERKVEQKLAPETKNSVTFTFQPLATDGTITYTCVYHCWVQDIERVSQPSNIINVTILDEPSPTVSNHTLKAAVPVPLWVIFLVSGLIGFAILVAAVSMVVCLIQRRKRKRQEQRDKESIWIHKDMAKDWTLSYHNKGFPMESTAETEPSHPYLSYKTSYTHNGSAAPFSSFRT
ncbi:protein HIDE1 [Mantella aurantiaca]